MILRNVAIKDIFLVLIAMFFLCPLRAQYDSVSTPKSHRLPEVNIGGWYSEIKAGPAAVQTLTARQLENLPSLQLSDALKYMSGVVVKDYGGAGGMKTVSVRGLGSQHTGVAYDGIALTDCQTGQIDLGKLMLDNVGNITLSTGLNENIFLPARLFSFSNLISINTPNQLPDKPLKLKVGFTVGTYGLLSPQVFAENLIRSKRHQNRYVLWNVSAAYMASKGDYPYKLHYGGATDSVSTERRQNSDVSTFNAEANVRVAFNPKQQLLVKWYYYDSERGLPKATLYYNLDAAQRLWNRNTFGQVQYFTFFGKMKWKYQVCGKFNYDYTHYLDPEYLNAQGRLDNHFHQYEGYLTNTVSYSLPKNNKKIVFAAALSNDLFYNMLKGNSLDVENPARFTSMTALTAKGGNKHFLLVGNLLLTTVNNILQGAQLGKNYVHLSPALSASFFAGDNVTIRAFYKNIFRMPTFNDLYYQEVGNIDLEPEKTHQWDLGVVLKEQRFAAGKVLLSASLDGYFNIVKDKIVAFPSRNLFSWTMMNYGKVWIGGAELNANLHYQFVKNYWLRLSGNCTYQKAVDRTNPEGRTFNHQIPYTPVWSGSASATFDMPWLSVSYALIVCGDRYALGQNIPANLVEGYVDHSITIGHTFPIKEVKLGFKCELLNLANKNYEIIRNYPMQGFGCRVKVVLEY